MTALPEAFRLATFRLTLTASEEMILPRRKGTVLRGGFGATFKRMVCIKRGAQDCPPCQLGNICPYGYIFETRPPADSTALRKLSAIPRPFVLEPPLEERTLYAPGQTITFGLVLVGRAMQYLPYFVEVFRALGEAGIGRRRAKYVLSRVEQVNPLSGADSLLCTADDVTIAPPLPAIAAADIAAHAVHLPDDDLVLRFQSPTRLKYEGDYIDRLDFHVVIRNALRRLSNLSRFHCDQPLDVDFRGIIASAAQVETVWTALEWVDQQRSSTRQGRDMNLGGLVGDVRFRGHLRPFLPLLLACQLVHLGKATSFGNGQFEIRSPSTRRPNP
jgi:hypothetical protein